MADFQTMRAAGSATRSALIDEGLKAHMNKVYATMSVGMVLTGAVAWAVGTNDAMMAAQLFFYVYASLMGLSLASIFAIYTGVSIAQTFLVTAIAFAGLSLYGYTTKRDLSGFGTFLMMGLIGIVVASIVNLFLASGALAFAISVIGVLIFAGLTAFDTQSIKNEYIQHAQMGDSEWLGKSAIMGALRLYLDFINMFIFLLQFLGNRE